MPNTILFAWELGDQLGHITLLSQLATPLHQQGFHCHAALKDLSRASSFFDQAQCRLLQAPTFLPKVRMQRPVLNLADTLALSGYLKPQELEGLVQGWESLLALTDPDILVLDYAPTAMLAARGHRCRTLMVGSGFAQPVAGGPLRHWVQTSQTSLLDQQEQRVLASINNVLSRRGQPELPQLSDLFAADQTVITTPPEFDLYGDARTGAVYHCKSPPPGQRQTVTFGASSAPKVLCYLTQQHPQFDLIVQGLAASQSNVFVVSPRCNPARLQPHQSDHFAFSLEPVDLAPALAEADLFVNHGNYGSTMDSLMAGTPVLALPCHVEQLLTAQTVQRLAVGGVLTQPSSATQIRQAVNELLGSDVIRDTAARFGAANQHLITPSLGELAVDLCDTLIKKGR